ncbi:DUF6226 family protein [Mycetocola miduiensis]|uniref:Uncharacterized protein n=1 Tax=Mycetocola miduiensis TaxID=995034 RepID=A0A1I5DVE3_9MICO|nr:DUF6226 family protein [Mycetocola miduiensis]SFO03199.1 hypothetical protein SAMN05216219_3118 [Mycetocola miduiensis]
MYHRPEVPSETFRDAAGRAIPYGARWGSDAPPDNAYSVDSHPERFAPVHLAADALIAHLTDTFEVIVEHTLAATDDLLRPVTDAVRAVRLTPASAEAASLTFVFTSYPGVLLHAGLLNDFSYPVCGCDACDETWQSVAAEMEWQVLAVAGGGYRETWRPGLLPSVTFSLDAVDGSQGMSGENRAADVPRQPTGRGEESAARHRTGMEAVVAASVSHLNAPCGSTRPATSQRPGY